MLAQGSLSAAAGPALQKINEKFIDDDSRHQINLPSAIKIRVRAFTNLKCPPVFVFDEAQREIFQLMRRDSFQRFLHSKAYRELAASKQFQGVLKDPTSVTTSLQIHVARCEKKGVTMRRKMSKLLVPGDLENAISSDAVVPFDS